jgi:ribonuclease R
MKSVKKNKKVNRKNRTVREKKRGRRGGASTSAGASARAGGGRSGGGGREAETLSGVLHKTKRGFGFMLAEDGGQDVFIPAHEMNGAMNGDRVRVLAHSRPRTDAKNGENGESGEDGGGRRNGRREGRVVKVLERTVKEVAGTFELSGGFGFVAPEARNGQDEVFIPRKQFGGAVPGDKVVAEITRYPGAANGAEGKIVEIIAGAGEPGGDIMTLIRSFGLSKTFPADVLEEAKRAGGSVSRRDTAGRRDLRGENIFTIDGADAKDFDDAVSIKKLAGGAFRLGVHIADVSHYVKEDGPLDLEVMKRGTSVYLLDQVVPMLPLSLSNGICSLNEGVDRLTLTVDMVVGGDGTVRSHEIYESVIHSKARLVYADISDLLENGDAALMKKYRNLYGDLSLMAELAERLRLKREKRGSVDFGLDEANIQLGADGIPVLVSVAERRTANRMIEEFMLLANETVAEEYCKRELPFIYRVHERPDADRIAEFRKFIGGLGLSLKGGPEGAEPSAFSALLREIEGRPEENVVNTLMLRAMKKAFYSTACEGHFGLSVKYYCHFTSPIRRCPDLMIHRIIKESMRGAVDDERRAELADRAARAALRSSETERKALELEREVEKLKKAEYMSYHIGETSEAVVSGVTSFGFFAELPNTVEGLVRVESMHGDFYTYEPEQYRLIGARTKKTFTIGDRLRIKVASVDVDSREINFVPAEV